MFHDLSSGQQVGRLENATRDAMATSGRISMQAEKTFEDHGMEQKRVPAPMPQERTRASETGIDKATPRRRGTVRERNRQRTYNDIYDSAMSLLATKGYEDVTVDDIAEAAGVSKATFFRYFGNKYGLVDEFSQRVAATIDAATNLEAMTAEDAIRTATDTTYQEWLDSAPQMRNLAREFVRTGNRVSEHLTDPMTRGMMATLVAIVETGQSRGEFSKAIEARLVAALIVYAWTIATVSWFDDADENGFKRSIHGLIEMLLQGLKP